MGTSLLVRAKWVAEIVYGDDSSRSFASTLAAVLVRTRALAEAVGMKRRRKAGGGR